MKITSLSTHHYVNGDDSSNVKIPPEVSSKCSMEAFYLYCMFEDLLLSGLAATLFTPETPQVLFGLKPKPVEM